MVQTTIDIRSHNFR